MPYREEDDGSILWAETQFESRMKYFIMNYKVHHMSTDKAYSKILDDSCALVIKRYLDSGEFPPYDNFDQAISYYAIYIFLETKAKLDSLESAIWNVVTEHGID